MTRACTVCGHDEAHAINVALIQPGATNRGIARQYGLEPEAVRRHRAKHIPELLVQASRAIEVANADLLLEQVEDLRVRAMSILDKAEQADELRTALAAIAQARGSIELLGRLLGELNEQPTLNVYAIGEAVQVAIIRALDPYPAAGLAVAEALASLEKGDSR